ncbi:MAG: tyrosine-type recombinase/integrase, partial [Planctomycetes bacterium]|nr:tyrosine-type recombinase/integrase [Planctomycetota bacterium]
EGIRKLTRAATTKKAKEIDILTPEQVRSLLRWVDGSEPDWSNLVRFLLLSGCRISEACAIDFDSDLLPDAIRLRAETTKTRETRDVTFACSPMLKQLSQSLAGQGQAFAAKQSGFRKMALRAKQSGQSFTAHPLRRTCASVLLNSGLLPPLLAATRMGHSISTMESTYAGLIRASLLSQGDSLEDVMGI